MTTPEPSIGSTVRWWDRQGLRGGLLAGIVFALIELLLMGALDGQVEVARFLRRVAAMWIGPVALTPDYPFAAVAVVGTIMHLGLSALFGLMFTWLTESIAPRLFRSPGALLVAAAAYGVLLWPINV